MKEDPTANTDVTHPFASLRLAKNPATTGRLVLVSVFPLGSWTPAIQMGLVSAVETIYPPGLGVSNGIAGKDARDLLQISVSANHGNSGGPIIDLTTGEVVGVLIRLVPAPIAIGGQLRYDADTFEMSGLMLAAPAKWVRNLLAKNSIKDEAIPAGKFVIW
jgi:S1-C subfamily serine protease